MDGLLVHAVSNIFAKKEEKEGFSVAGSAGAGAAGTVAAIMPVLNLVVAAGSAFISYQCNRNLEMFPRIMWAVLAFLFGWIFLLHRLLWVYPNKKYICPDGLFPTTTVAAAVSPSP